jgi:acyl-CoA thioester hydrolase
LGLTSPRFRKEGMRMAAVEQRIEYKRELQAGDTVTIRSRVLEVGNRSIRFSHEMKNDETGETAAIRVIAAVYFDAKTKKATPLPEDVRERASAAINGFENGAEILPQSESQPNA